MPERIDLPETDGVDFTWVMQVTFVLAIVVGAPVVAGLSLFATLPTWGARVQFAIQVGAVVWLVLALGVFGYAKYARSRG